MKNSLFTTFGILSFLLCIASCSLQRQSPISRNLFVKQHVQIKDKIAFDTLAQTKKESELFLPTKTVNEVENTAISQLYASQIKSRESLINKTKNINQKITKFVAKLGIFPKNDQSKNKSSQYGDGDEYVKDDSWKAQKYAIIGMIFSIIGFLLVGLGLLLGIILNPLAIFIGLLLCLPFLIIGLIFSIRAKKYITKYRTNENREDRMKWIGRSAMANVGIILATIIFGLLILTGLVFILMALI